MHPAQCVFCQALAVTDPLTLNHGVSDRRDIAAGDRDDGVEIVVRDEMQ